MSIEQKMGTLVEDAIVEANAVTKNALAPEASNLPAGKTEQNPDNEKNDVDNEDPACDATTKKPNRATVGASTPEANHLKAVRENLEVDVSADVAALFNNETLTEEFKTKATTIFEAAVITRVKDELTKLEEALETTLQESIEKIKDSLVEDVNSYLVILAEQFVENNKVALRQGIKTDILEGFVDGLKELFTEHYIDVPVEKYDVLNSLEEEVAELTEKLNDQMNSNVDLTKSINEMKKREIILKNCEGLVATDAEKFKGLAEEIAFDPMTFDSKVKTIKEGYFSTKAPSVVNSVVTDTPVEILTEQVAKKDPATEAVLNIFKRNA